MADSLDKAQEAAKPQTEKPRAKVNRFVGGGGDLCEGCGKTVYIMERLEVCGRLLHKKCFKCAKCGNQLNIGSFSTGGSDLYCTTHYKQMFTEKGSYDAFGVGGKGKWAKKIEQTSPETGSEAKSE